MGDLIVIKSNAVYIRPNILLNLHQLHTGSRALERQRIVERTR